MLVTGNNILALLGIGLFASLQGTNAKAALILDLDNGAVVVNDNGAGDLDPTVGSIITNNITVLPGIISSVNVATSNSPGGAQGLLHVNSIDVANTTGGAATLSVRISDINFTSPGSSGSAMKVASDGGLTLTGGAIGNSVSFQSFADPSNAQPASAVSTAMQTFTKTTSDITDSFNYPTASANWIRGAGAYSISNLATITMANNAQINFTGTTTVTPEPATLGLAALAALGLLHRRRKA